MPTTKNPTLRQEVTAHRATVKALRAALLAFTKERAELVNFAEIVGGSLWDATESLCESIDPLDAASYCDDLLAALDYQLNPMLPHCTDCGSANHTRGAMGCEYPS